MRATNNFNGARHWIGEDFSINAVIAGFCLLLIGMIWTVVITHTRFERHRVIDAAIKQNSDLAIAFEQYAVRTIESANTDTRYVQLAYARAGSRTDIRPERQRLAI